MTTDSKPNHETGTAVGARIERGVRARARWHDARKERPAVSGRHDESACVLCLSTDVSDPFVGWWNEADECWRVGHWKADSLPVPVRWWRELPPLPRTVSS